LRLNGLLYLAFVIDVFARRIVALRDLHANRFRVTAWRASTSMKTQFVLDALDQAIWQRIEV
jgi:transposase InsO family protein